MLIFIDNEFDQQRWHNRMMENQLQRVIMEERFTEIVGIRAKSFEHDQQSIDELLPSSLFGGLKMQVFDSLFYVTRIVHPVLNRLAVAVLVI